MSQNFFIGVDGGATKCIVRVEDEVGELLGRETTGPANIRISVPQAWQSIHLALEAILNPLNLSLADTQYHWQVGMGLAGCEVPEAYENFLEQPHPFETLIITSDAHVACLGAHGGRDGAIIIIGTGVVGFQVEPGQTVKVGGWGFPHDDEGGGAWLGLHAVRETLHWLDGRQPESSLARAIYANFSDDLDRFVIWANQANSTAFAELAPVVIQQSQAGDRAALGLLQRAAQHIDRIGVALAAAQSDGAHQLPCSLIGGIAPFIGPLLNATLRDRMVPCRSTPDVGAVRLVRDYLASDNYSAQEVSND
jgi:glucosamine kinase